MFEQDGTIIDDRRLCGQLAERLDHARQAIRVFGAAARVETDARAVFANSEALDPSIVDGRRPQKRPPDTHTNFRAGTPITV
jgi:hypothetical protein